MAKKKLVDYYKVPKVKGMKRPEGAGNFDNQDDYNFVKTINPKAGTVQDAPTAAKDLVNKEYVDASFSAKLHAGEHEVGGDDLVDHDNLTNFAANEHFTEGSIDHGAIGGLTDDDHTQYLLRQPTANVVINESGGNFTFRIEGQGYPNLLHIGYNTNRIGINTATPYRTLHVVGRADLHTYVRIDTATANKHPVMEFCENGTRRGYIEYHATNHYIRIRTDEINSDVFLDPAGTGKARFGTYVAEEPRLTGYIEIKDAGGTVRKLVVCS